MFQSTHDGLENWKTTSPGLRELCSSEIFRCCRMTPCWCTKHFGGPDVPLEYSTYKGSENGTRSNSRGSSSLDLERNADSSIKEWLVWCSGIKTTAGLLCPRRARISEIFAKFDLCVPLYVVWLSANTIEGWICCRREMQP